MKALERLKEEGHVSSKSYGLGTERLWKLEKTPLTIELGYFQPKDKPIPEVHSFLYEHDKYRGDIYAALVIAGFNFMWGGEGRQGEGFRWDLRCKFLNHEFPFFYGEIEITDKGYERTKDKIQQYKTYFLDNKYKKETAVDRDFQMIGFVKTEDQIEQWVKIYEELRLPYYATRIDEFIADPRNALLSSRLEDRRL
jgi:hypothetical protein